MLLYAVQFVQGVQYVTFALIFGGMLSVNRTNKSLLWFFCNYALGAVGLAVTLGKAFEPAWLSSVLGLEIPQVRYGFLHLALISFMGRYRSTRWIPVVLAVGALPFYIAWSGKGYQDPAFAARNFLILDVALAVQTALSAWIVLRSDERATLFPRAAMSLFLALYSATEVVRFIVQIATNDAPASAMPGLELFSLVVYVVASSATPVAFIWLFNARLTDDLRSESLLDPLTQVFNRRGLREISEREIARCQRSGQPFALAVGDIDHFKALNDTFGHQGGDLVLREVAALLRGLLRRHDVVARIGGEEFVVVLPEADTEQARRLIERLRESIEVHPFVLSDATARITISFGVTVCRDWQDHTLDSLIGEADMALYAAKQAGRNRTQFYAPASLAAAPAS